MSHPFDRLRDDRAGAPWWQLGLDLVDTWNQVIDAAVKIDEQRGWMQVRDAMSGYYVNLSVVATLLVAVVTIVLVATNRELVLLSGAWALPALHPLTLLGVSGSAAIGCLVLCVTDCIMIDGNLRKVRECDHLRKYIAAYRTLLGNPWRWLMVGLAFAAFELNVFLLIQFSSTTAATSSALSVVLLIAILLRWRDQSQFMDSLAEASDALATTNRGAKTPRTAKTPRKAQGRV